MKTVHKQIIFSSCIATIVIFVIVILFLHIKPILDAEHTKMYVNQSALSVYKSLDSEIYKGNPNIERFFSQIGREWKALSDENCDALLTELVKRKEIEDCNGALANKSFLDPWGHRFVVCFRRNINFFEFIIVSRGPDGIYGTKDDITDQWNELPPSLN